MNIDLLRIPDEEAPDGVLASLLLAAAPPVSPGPLPGEADALAEFRAVGHDRGRTPMHTSRTRRRALVATAATAGMLTVAGVAAAATGTLPGAAQQTAQDMLAKVGISVPGADAHSAGHADTRGKSGSTGATADDSKPTDPASHGKGADVSNLARTTTSTGVDKGSEISTLASGGKSRAGQNGKPTDPGSQGTTHKPTDPGTQGTTHKPTDPGTQGTTHEPTDPGTQGTTHEPTDPSSTGVTTSGSHRP
jgi:hypothetical protein